MTMEGLITRNPEVVKSHVLSKMEGAFDHLLARVDEVDRPEELESEVWRQLFGLGRLLLATLLASSCRRATERDWSRRGLAAGDVSLRLDADYWACLTTTMGDICVPLFAYRDRSSGLSVTRTPAREEVFPLRRRCRSSALCLQWEARLGSEFPFRKAQEALGFFSHGEVSVEDTTIARHTVAVGLAVERGWLYREPSEIRRLLRDRAARDKETGRPILYCSTDAHAERTYVDATWQTAWKMTNGIRLWFIDRHNGAVVHVGGEYTWGDCREVGAIIDELVEDGILPRNGDYGDGVLALLIAVTDGMPWIEEHVLSRLPWAQCVLDLYHALERLGRFAATCFGKGTKLCRQWYRRLARHLIAQPKEPSPRPNRRGHKKTKRGNDTKRRRRHRRRAGSAWDLLGALYEEQVPAEYDDDLETLLQYFEANSYRMDYDQYRKRGWEVGSGAMEALHRIAGQARLKIPGGRWLQSTAQAIFNLRMLYLVGRWDTFWAQDGLPELLQHSFTSTKRA